MKNLKTFESFSYSNFIENIKDLFLDMSDEYYKMFIASERNCKIEDKYIDFIEINKGEYINPLVLSLEPIWRNEKERIEFLEKIENIIDYIKTEGFKVECNYSSGWRGSRSTYYILDAPGIMSYKIYITK
jgi:hypothetical protein